MRLSAPLAIVLLLAGVPLAAHHWLSASFDARRPFTMTGVVTTFAWTNPHVALHLDVRDKRTGAVTSWMMDMGSPSSLTRLGWSKRALEAGDTIVVEGIPARDGSLVGYAYAVTITATGRRLPAAPTRAR
jgi:hypothetical protein